MNDLKIKQYQLQTGHHVVCFVDPITNKRKRKKFETKALAKSFHKEIETKYQSKGPQGFNQTLIKDYLKLHLEKSPNSRVMDRKRHFKSFTEEFGDRRINQVGKNELNGWFQKIKAQHDLSDRTLGTIKSDLNSFFHFLEDEGAITESPLAKIKFERRPPARRVRVTLSVDEVHRVLENANIFSPKTLYPVLFIAAYTGARRGEVIKLKRNDIDFETGLIHFRKTKNGEDRSILCQSQFKRIFRNLFKITRFRICYSLQKQSSGTGIYHW